WEDLTPYFPELPTSSFRWPQDIQEFRKRIFIDFGLKRAQVAAMDVDTFSAVQQIGPNYGPDEEGIRRLLEVAGQWERKVAKNMRAMPLSDAREGRSR